MHLIVGLGNPGLKYVDTRHNVGFMLLDYLAQASKVSFAESKWKALIAKPLCGMNLSSCSSLKHL